MAVTGFAGGDPVKAGPPVGDATARCSRPFGAMAALSARERTGEGQQVDVARSTASLHIQAPYTGQYFLLGQPAAADRQRDRLVRALQRLPLRGRPVRAPGLLQRQVLPQLCAAMDRPDLAADERFAGNEHR